MVKNELKTLEQYEGILHPNSPDLAPCDFFPGPEAVKNLSGWRSCSRAAPDTACSLGVRTDPKMYTSG